MAHSIRLRDPWSLLPPPSIAATPAPLTWVFAFSRKFNAPTGLAALQSVVLELKPLPLARNLSVQLNGQALCPTVNQPASDLAADAVAGRVPVVEPLLATPPHDAPLGTLYFELRQQLQAFNVLQVTIEAPSEAVPSAPPFHTFCEARLLL